MADEKTAQQDAEKSPFADFETESYDRGELVPEEPAGEPAEPSEEVEEQQNEGGTNEAPPAKDGESQPVAKEGEQPPKKKQSVQERINEVTRLRREAERRAEAAEAELQRLRQAPPQPPKAEEKPAPAAADDPDAPKPEDFEYGELDTRYIRAVAAHEADRRFAELRKQDQEVRQTREQEERQERARESFEKMLDYGSKKHDDFYQKVVIDSEEGKWPLSETLGELLLGSDVGGDIAYHLASNPQEAEKVYKYSPVEQARYFGRMEAKFSAGQSAAPGVEAGKPAPKTPKAPAPIEHARGAGGQFQATADTDDFAAFEARVNGSK